jgi:exo-beta-1,3-glucanase (GH17 family)
MNVRHVLAIVAACLAMTACSSASGAAKGPVKVEVVRTDAGYVLLRGGEPYTVRGAGMATDDIARFAAYGGNSIRTWTTRDSPQDIGQLLDEAQAHGVTVALGLPMRAERHGFDYDDPAAVAAQRESFREDILRYRDHPALLAWIIGNELNHSYTNPRVWDAVEDVARMIEELDPNHPVTTALAGFYPQVVAEVLERAPSLDFLSAQLYGSLFGLPAKVAEAGFTGPFMVTEWGTIGYWEMEKTPWGAPVELTSSEKADVIARAWREVLSTFPGQLIGSYVFKWGWKQERTPTWFGLLLESGETTESADVMQHAWTGSWPANRSPRVDAMTLDGRSARQGVSLVAGRTYQAALEVTDPDGDALRFRWEVKRESDATQEGGDFEASIPSLDGVLQDPASDRTAIAVKEPGRYRLFAYAFDGKGHAAHANIPFLVEPGPATAEGFALRPLPAEWSSGRAKAVSYSGFREGQHPDRGAGAVNPDEAEVLEDLQILVRDGFRLIRMYDSRENTRTTLELIRRHELPIEVLLGVWLDAELSNHEGCPWLVEPIPAEKLTANAAANREEVLAGIALANEYQDIVVAVAVGNEALETWTDHLVPLDQVIAYVRQVRAAVRQPVTVANSYAWWRDHGATLAAGVDFLGAHSYPLFEGQTIDTALQFLARGIEQTRAVLPGRPLMVLEAGWPTTSSEFPDQASEANQRRHYRELMDWSAGKGTTVFFFEAFDEPWKGNPNDPLTSEKHFGLYRVDRTHKEAMRK